MDIQEDHMTELPNAKTELPSADEDLPEDVIVVILHPNQDDATTLTELEGRAMNVILRNYFLKSDQRVDKNKWFRVQNGMRGEKK